MSTPHVSPLIIGYCKRGHPRNLRTTFERRVQTKGKTYIVRECRICHALRNTKPMNPDAPRRSKWKRFLAKECEA